jgi:capsular exopolysaccharide synthesis family protein
MDITLPSLIRLLRRHWIIVGACIAGTVVLVGVYTHLSKPTYEASSLLRFDEQQLNLPQLVQELSTENRINTDVGVLQDRSAAVAVIDSLGLRAQPRLPRGMHASTLFSRLQVAPGADTATLIVAAAADGRVSISHPAATRPVVTGRVGDTLDVSGVSIAVRPLLAAVSPVQINVVSLDQAVRNFNASLKVDRPQRDADLIAIRVRNADPVRAAAAANLLGENLITGGQRAQLARTGSAVAFLNQQLDTLGTQLRASEDALQSYTQRTGAVDAPEQARTQVGRLAQVQADRGAIVAERNALGALLLQIRTAGPADSGGDAPASRLISFPTLFRNQAASELLGSLSQVQNQRSELLTRRTMQDPDVQVLTTRIHQIDRQLQSIAETYLQGLTNQIASLDAVARGFGGALDSLPAKEVATARLQRDVQVHQDLYTLIQTRLKEAQITDAMVDPSISVVDRAVAPDRPVRPRPMVNLALSLVLGSIIGAGAVLGRTLMDHSVRSRADALQAAGLPVLGAVPRLNVTKRTALPNAWSTRRQFRNREPAMPATTAVASPKRSDAAEIASLLVTRPDAPAGYVESFNQLHTNLALTCLEHSRRVLLVTSPLPGEGKTLSAINFALTLAGKGRRVLLIDADLRCGLIGDVFGCERQPGFAELLAGTASFESARRDIAVGPKGSLVIVPSGSRIESPGQLMTVERVREVLDPITSRFDSVIIDTPPVNLLSDAALLGSAADAVLLVVRAGHTRIEELSYAMDQLLAAHAPVVGTLLNDIDTRRNETDDGSYRYLGEVERYYAPSV